MQAKFPQNYVMGQRRTHQIWNRGLVQEFARTFFNNVRISTFSQFYQEINHGSWFKKIKNQPYFENWFLWVCEIWCSSMELNCWALAEGWRLLSDTFKPGCTQVIVLLSVAGDASTLSTQIVMFCHLIVCITYSFCVFFDTDIHIYHMYRLRVRIHVTIFSRPNNLVLFISQCNT